MISSVALVPHSAILSPFTYDTVNLDDILRVVSGLPSGNCTTVPLPTNSRNSAHSLLAHNVPAQRVQLLALRAVSAAGVSETTPARSALYTATVLQHAALLLLLLVSDSVVVVLPTAAVPASLLQLLHLVAAVHKALVQQLQHAEQQAPANTSSNAAASSLSVLQLLSPQRQPAQLHIALQASAGADSWPGVAAAAVQQAELTLIKCKAAAPSQALQQQLQEQQQQGASQSRDVSATSRSSRRRTLFELAGVHCCCETGGTNTAPAKRRAILGAIQQQLLACDRPAAVSVLQLPTNNNSGAARQQYKQQTSQAGTALDKAAAAAGPAAAFPGLDQLVAHVVAGTAAEPPAADEATQLAAAPFSEQQLQQLWQDLLQLLFTAARDPCDPLLVAGGSQHQQGNVQQCRRVDLLPSFHDIILGPVDITAGEDESSSSSASEDDAEDDEAWEEVQQQDEQQQQQQQQGDAAKQRQLPGHLLAAAVDPLYVVSAKSCRRAARAAFRVYTQVVPQRYTAAAHQAALEQALQAYAAAGASGPAAPELQEVLVAACERVWRDGRQQCSQLSLTGRPCTLSPHDSTQQPHDSSTQLQVCAPDGRAAAPVPDWFGVEAANVTPAQQLLQLLQANTGLQQEQQQQAKLTQHKQQQPGHQACLAPSGRLINVAAQLHKTLLPVAAGDHAAGAVTATVHTASSSTAPQQLNSVPSGSLQQQQQQPHTRQNPGYTLKLTPDASNSSSSSKVLQLGPWMSLWHMASGPGAYDPSAGLSGPAWVQGFEKLQEIRVLCPASAAVEPQGAVAAGAVDGGGGGGGGGTSGGRADAAGGKVSAAAAAGGQQRQTPKKPDFASQLKRKGPAGRGAGSASRTPEPVLGPEDFPTLQQAVGTKKHGTSTAATAAAAAAKQQQQQSPAASPSKSFKADKQQRQQADGTAAAAVAAAAAGKATQKQQQQQQQQLLSAWQKLALPPAGSDAPAGTSGAGGSGRLTAAAAATGSAAAGGGRGGGGRGGRGGRGTAAAAAAGTAAAAAAAGRGRREAGDAPATAAATAGAAVLTSLWIGLEYESLDGMRIILQPHQLPTSHKRQVALHQRQQQQQQQSGELTFATAAAGAGQAGSAAREQQPADPRHRRAGRQQQQQQGRSTTPASPPGKLHAGAHHPAAAAAPDSAGPSLQGPGVQLLQQDIPLFISLDQLQLPGRVPGTAAHHSSSTTTTTSGGLAAAASTGSAIVATPLSLLQLQRIYIRTPPAPFRFASQHCAEFVWSQQQQQQQQIRAVTSTPAAQPVMATASGAAASRNAAAAGILLSSKAATASTAAARAGSRLVYTCDQEQLLPEDSLVVVTLPKVYAAPEEWLQAAGAAVAATTAAAGAPAARAELLAESSSSRCAGTPGVQQPASGRMAADAHAAAQGSATDGNTAGIGPVPGAVDSSSSSVGGCMSLSSDNILLPLLPLKPAAAVWHSTGVAEALPLLPDAGWSGWLTAGSLLYPVALQTQPEGKGQH